MPKPFIFRCPTTKLNVQGLIEREDGVPDRYVPQRCGACGGLHLVSPSTGKLLAERAEREA